MKYKLKNYDFRNGVRKTKTRLTIGITAVGLLLGSGGLSFALVNSAQAASNVIVTPGNTQGWTSSAPLADTRPGGAVNFVSDSSAPGSPNVGALGFTTDSTNNAKAQYMHATNTPLADITALSYYTKQNSASFADGQASFQLPVCLGGVSGATCIGFTTLVFEPYWNLGNNGNAAVLSGTWQKWDVSSSSANLWSSKAYSNGSCTIVNGSGGPPLYSIAGLQADCPSAVVAGFGVGVGSYNPSYDVETDLVEFNDTTYNFEPTATVTIAKYLDGAVATATSANNTAFPMVSSWDADNLGAGSGSYTLSPSGYNNPNPYFATTSNMTVGADYATNEVMGATVASTCTPFGAPYALLGYSTGDSLSAAEAASVSQHSPAFFNIQSDKYVVVRNVTCKTPTSAAQCKHGGWQDFNAPTFQNQGQCVKFVKQHSSQGPGNGNQNNHVNNNHVVVSNSNTQNAKSGNAKVKGNTNGGNAKSGKANNDNKTKIQIQIGQN